MQMQLRRPRNLKPAAHVMLRAAHVGGNQESLILGEGLRLPVMIEGIGAVEESIRYRTAAGKELNPSLVLAVAGLDSSAGGEPIT